MFRRHPILATLLLLVLLVVGAVVAFLLTFDLDRYRDRVQEELSAALSRPVRLGEVHLGLERGLALTLDDLHIESPGPDMASLRVDRAFLLLEILPLLKGQVSISRLKLDAPHLRMPVPARPGLLIEAGSLHKSQIRSVSVVDGRLDLVDLRHPERPFQLTLEGIDGTLGDLAPSHKGFFRFSGALIQADGRAPLTLEGQFRLPADLSTWRTTVGRVHLAVSGLSPAPFVERYLPETVPAQATGDLSADLRLKRPDPGNWQLEAEVGATDLTLDLPRLYSAPLTLNRLHLEGVWEKVEKRNLFRKVALTLDNLQLRGEGRLEHRQDGAWLEATVSAPALQIKQAQRFLPDRGLDAATFFEKRLPSGNLRLQELRLAGLLGARQQKNNGISLQRAEFALDSGRFFLTPEQSLENLAFTALYTPELLSIDQGRADLLAKDFRFSGEIHNPFSASPQIIFEADGTLAAEKLWSHLPKRLRSKAVASGDFPVSLLLEGPPSDLRIDLQGSLDPLEVAAPKIRKAAGAPGSFLLVGRLSPEQLTLDHVRIRALSLQLRGRGHFARQPPHPFELTLDTAPFSAQRIAAWFPRLRPFDPQGQLAAHFELQGSLEGLRQHRGEILLRDVGLNLPEPLADISKANGTLHLEKDLARLEKASARLGTSPLTFNARVIDFTDPRAELELQADSLAADALIFPSDKAVLRDLSARLTVTRDRLELHPVKLRLDGGTQVTVYGAVREFSGPEVSLDIVAPRADIDEVIALWRKPAEASAKATPRRKPSDLRVQIQAQVAEGNIGHLDFRNAEGKIVYADRVLTIFPLSLAAGEGHCGGRVVADMSQRPTRLKVSGHLDNFDAAAIYQSLLERRGLVTGTLRGDFFVEGDLGGSFLETTRGGFHVYVKNGVLRKFRILSKVFSLLNVSQILTFNLPDMSLEGMPFKRLRANFSLSRGLLSTEDLFVDSTAMNLSLVGDIDLVDKQLDLLLGVKPLRTVDKVVTQIPLAGWLLAGEEKALVTAHFSITGSPDDPDVTPVPITSVSEKAIGIFKRVFNLPGKVLTDVRELLEKDD